MTNFEAIKQMNQEELAFFLATIELNNTSVHREYPLKNENRTNTTR